MNKHFEDDRMGDALNKQESLVEKAMRNPYYAEIMEHQSNATLICDSLEIEVTRFMERMATYRKLMSPMTAATPMSTLIAMMIEELTVIDMPDYVKAIRDKIEDME